MTLKLTLFRTPITAIGLGMLLLAGSVVGLALADAQVGRAIQARYDSYLLADELRQSSDDLTRLARTFVATGDAKWEQQYFEVLDIRNGKRPRPAHYERIYWDFRAADATPPGGDGEAMSLTDRMRRAGFTEQEFARLKQAQDNSNDLVSTETIAMNMIKGLYDDGAGRFTRQAPPDRARALQLMNDGNYHAFKAKIMDPVNQFMVLLDERTQAAVQAAQARQSQWAGAVGVLTLLVTLCSAWAMRQWWWINRRLGGAPDDVVQIVRRLGDGDLGTTAAPPGCAPDSVLARLLELRERLAGIIDSVRSNAESVATASREIAQGNLDLSTRTEQQASALEETAATMNQLGGAASDSAQHAEKARDLAQHASSVVEDGGRAMDQVVQTMKGIDASSKQISDIVSVIDGIAFQTNILALNAAVEAARAGEQGRGFAVVASEVRSLAQRSAASAREIKTLIAANVSRVEGGAQLVDEAGRKMEQIVESIRGVNEIVADIQRASAEQSSSVQQVGRIVGELDRGTQQNAALVEQSAAAAEALKRQAAGLVDAVAVFRVSRPA